MSFPPKNKKQVDVNSLIDTTPSGDVDVMDLIDTSEKKNSFGNNSLNGGTPSPLPSNGPSYSPSDNFFNSPAATFIPASPVVAKVGDKQINLEETAPILVADKKVYAENLRKKIDGKIPLSPDEYNHIKQATGYDDELTTLALNDTGTFFDVKTIKDVDNKKSNIVEYLKSQDATKAQFGVPELYVNYDLDDTKNVSSLFQKFEEQKKSLETKASTFSPFDLSERANADIAKDELKGNSPFMQQYNNLKDWKALQVASNLLKDGNTDPKSVGLAIQQETDAVKNDQYWKSHIPSISNVPIVDAARALFHKDTPLQDYELENTGADYLKQALAVEISKKKLAGDDPQKDVEDFVKVNEGQRNLYNKYPDVRYGQIAAEISKAKAIEEGISVDSGDNGILSRAGYVTTGDDVIRLAKENGLYNNPVDKKLVDKIANDQDPNKLLTLFVPGYSVLHRANAPIENFSFVGQFGEGVKGVAESTAKSIVDLAQLRGNSTISAEQYNDDVINSWKKGQSSLDATQKNIALVGNTTGQIVGQALSTLAFSGAGKAAGLAGDAVENLGFWASGALTSYEDGKKTMLDVTDSDVKAEAGGLFIGFINAASEKIFKDTKVFGDVFGQKLGNVLKNIDEDKLYTEATRDAVSKFINSEIPQVIKNFAVEGNKEGVEEFLTAVGQDVITAVLGDNTKFDPTKTWENAMDTYVSTLIGGSLAAGRAAYTDFKINPNAAASLQHAAEAPNYYISAIQELQNKNQLSEAEANKKIQIVNTAVKINNELAAVDNGLNNRQKAAYISYRTTQAQMQDMVDKTTDPTLKLKLDENIKVLDEQKTKILDGLQFNQNLQPLDNLYDQEQRYKAAEKLAAENNTPENIEAAKKAKQEYADSVINYYKTPSNEIQQDNTGNQGTETTPHQTKATETQDTQTQSTNTVPEEQGLLTRAKEIVNTDIIKGFTAGILKDAAENNPDEFKAHLSEIADQALDPQSLDPTVRTYGQELVDIATKLYPNGTGNLQAAPTINEPAIVNEQQNTEPDITVGEMIDKPVVYNGQKGTLTQDGQTLIFKVEGQNKEYELGNVDEVKDKPLADYNISHQESVVSVGDNNDFIVRGQTYTNPFEARENQSPLEAITYDKEGNVINVRMKNTDGERRTFKGNVAEDLAYQIHLKEITKDNETKSNFENFINSDESAQEAINNAGVSAATEETTNTPNEQVPGAREKITPIPSTEVKEPSGVSGEEVKSNWNYEGEGDAFASNKDSRDGKSAYVIRILGNSYNRAKQRGELDTKSPLKYEGNKEYVIAVDGNGNTVGKIELQGNGGVEHIVVAPEFARKGVGTELIRQIESKGAKVDVTKSKQISPDAASFFNKLKSENKPIQNEQTQATENTTQAAEESKPEEVVSEPAPETTIELPEGVAESVKSTTYKEKAKTIADKIRNADLPQWLVNTDPNIKGSGLTGAALKNALANAVELVGDLLDKGVDIKKAISQGIDSLKKVYADNDSFFDEKKVKEGFTAYVKEQFPDFKTVKDIAEDIKNGVTLYEDAVEGKSDEYIFELNKELYGSGKFNLDEDGFKTRIRQQKEYGISKEDIVANYDALKPLTKRQRELIEEVFGETADTDKAAAELQEAFKQLAKGEKPKSVLKKLGASDFSHLVTALSDALSYKAVSNVQLEAMADYIVDSIELDKAPSYINALVNNVKDDVRQLLRAKLIVALEKEGKSELATQMVNDMANEATVSGRQTQSLARAYQILGAKGSPKIRTAFAMKYAESVQQKAQQLTQHAADVISEQQVEIGRLNEQIHNAAQKSNAITKIKDIISNLCNLRSKK